MKIILVLSAILFSSCSRHTVYMGNSRRDKKYRDYIKTATFRYIPEDSIPINCGFVRDSSEDLIDRKTHIVIAKQWYDFGDGSEPGIYYITMPTKWEIRRNRNEEKYLYRKYGMKKLSQEEFYKMAQDTAHFTIYY